MDTMEMHNVCFGSKGVYSILKARGFACLETDSEIRNANVEGESRMCRLK